MRKKVKGRAAIRTFTLRYTAYTFMNDGAYMYTLSYSSIFACRSAEQTSMYVEAHAYPTCAI